MRSALPPGAEAGDVHRRRGGHVLQMCLLQPSIAGLPQAADPDRLRDCPLDARPPGDGGLPLWAYRAPVLPMVLGAPAPPVARTPRIPLRGVAGLFLSISVFGGCSPEETSQRVYYDGELVPVRERVIGTIALEPQIVGSDTVRVGQPVGIRIRTSGNTCVVKGETQVTADELRAVIVPYDYPIDVPPRTLCQDLERIFHHVARVSFARLGTAELEVRGYDYQGRQVVHTRHVMVQ
jgi:hypothetical protein